MKIGNFELGSGHPTFIVAELSCNHNQDFEKALELVRQAKLAGADAVKLQTYTPDTITLDCDNEHFMIKGGTIWDGETLHHLYSRAYTPWEWTKPLMEEANRLGMELFSSPFDVTAVDFLETLDVPAYKIASFEAMDHLLLKRVAQTGKPVIISTGITDLPEIAEAVKILREHGTQEIIVLKCTSSYPAPIEDANLKTIENIKETFGVLAGLSDHTQGIEVPICAVCLGADFIEKHFTLNNKSGSPDDNFSLEPQEFKQMVDSIRKVEKATGVVKYHKSGNTQKSQMLRRSLFVVSDLKAGEKFTPENVRSIRPGNGLPTRYYDQVLNSVATQDLKRGTPLSFSLIRPKGMKVLFLGQADNPLIEFLRSVGEQVDQTSEKITVDQAQKYDFAVSYGYRHLIRKPIIDLFPGRIINLHISYLPWNRGADPNLWSVIEGTPKGVTIHHVDCGLDTGDIIVQREVLFDLENDTLASSYQKLQMEILQLFQENWSEIKLGNLQRTKQDREAGTSHKLKDRPKLPETGWETKLKDLIPK